MSSSPAKSVETVSPATGAGRQRRRRFAVVGTVGLLAVLCAGVWWAGQPLQVANEPDPGASTVELEPAKQKFIWDAEHVTFEIERYIGKPFATAIKVRDADRLAGFLRSDFRATILETGGTETIEHPPITQSQRRADRVGTRIADAHQFVQSLLGSLSVFSRIQRTRFRVLTINRDENDASRWKSRCLLTADGLGAEQYPVHWESEQLIAYHFADDEEIQRGRILDRWSVERETVRSSQRFLLQEVTKAAGLSHLPIPDNWKLSKQFVVQYTHQIAVEDFDRDGFLDIAVGTYGGRPLLLRSVEGTRFKDIAAEMQLKPWRPDLREQSSLAGWIDYDNDGFPDLILGKRLYHNVAGKRFVDVTSESGLHFDYDPMGCTVADYDGDGRLDLYILYQRPAATRKRTGPPAPWIGDTLSGADNALWRNEGNGRFRNVTVEADAGGGKRHTFAALWFYFDNDRFPDLYLANDFGHNVLLRNRGNGTFEDVSQTTAVSDFATSMGACAGDLDNDGSTELYVANMYSKMGRRIIGQVSDADYPPGVFEQIQGSCTGNRLYTKRSGESRYRETSEAAGVNAVGWAYAPAAVDLDGDGRLDLYATTGFLSFDRRKPDG